MEWILKVMIKGHDNEHLEAAKRLLKYIIMVALVVYGIFLAKILLFEESRLIARELMNQNRYQFINLMPFDSIKKYMHDFQYFQFTDWINNMVGNICLFIPMGLAVTALCAPARKILKGLLMGVFFSLMIEIIQLRYNLGVFDVDDILLNATGYLIGYFIFIKMYKSFKKKYCM